MRFAGFLLGLLLGLAASASNAAPMSNVVGALATGCMTNVGNPKGVGDFFARVGATPVPNGDGRKIFQADVTLLLGMYVSDNDDMVYIGLRDDGGCFLFSLKAVTADVERLLATGFPDQIKLRPIVVESDKNVRRTTYAVTAKGQHLFLVIFGPPTQGGAMVEVAPESSQPKSIKLGTLINWP